MHRSSHAAALLVLAGCLLRPVPRPPRTGEGFGTDPASLAAEPATLVFDAAGTVLVTLTNIGDRTAALSAIAIEPADVGFALTDGLPTAVLPPRESLEFEVVFAPVSADAADAVLSVTWDSGVLLVPLAAGPRSGGVEIGLPELTAWVPCDLVAAITVRNAAADPLALVLEAPGLAAELATVTWPDGAAELVLDPGEVREAVVHVFAGAPATGTLTVASRGDDVRSEAVASAPITVAYVERRTAEQTGGASVELPADADPASIFVTVNGVPADDVEVDGLVVTVVSPAVGPADVVTVDHGVLARCR